MRLMIVSQKFRHLLMMRRSHSSAKLKMIRDYAKKRAQYNLSKKAVDQALLAEKEKVD